MVIQVQFNASDQSFKTAFDASGQSFSTRFDASDQSFAPAFDAYMKDVPEYNGAYEVTPQVDAQSLPTAQKLMADDVTINAIPIYNVSNTSGGSTVYIAREV